MSQVRRTRIVCTIGPSSSSPHVLRSMIQSGMDVARLNFSHGDPDTHREAAQNVREAAEAVGRPVALLGDLQGPKIRTGTVEGTFQKLVRGRTVTLVGAGVSAPTRAFGATCPASGEVKPNQIEVSHVELVQALRPGDRVLLDDGRIELAVRAVSDSHADASVIRGGLLGDRKGISVPGRPLPLPALTDKDIHDLKLAMELDVDYIALSFVRRPEDIVMCQQQITGHNKSVPVIAKLEKLEAIRNLDKILEVADGVMVARGDPGVEVKLGHLPALQQGPAADARGRGKPPSRGAAPDRAVFGRGPPARQPGARHRPDDLERHRSRPGERHGPSRGSGGGGGGGPGRPARPDQPAQSRDRLDGLSSPAYP